MAADTRDSLSERILKTAVTRLAGATTSSGYATDAGQRTYRARRSLQAEDLPCHVVWDGGEQVVAGGAGDKVAVAIVQTVIVESFGVADRADTGEVLGKLKADSKKAVLRDAGKFIDATTGESLGVLAYVGAEPLPREDGAVGEGVRVTFAVTHPEKFGDPYALS